MKFRIPEEAQLPLMFMAAGLAMCGIIVFTIPAPPPPPPPAWEIYCGGFWGSRTVRVNIEPHFDGELRVWVADGIDLMVVPEHWPCRLTPPEVDPPHPGSDP